MKNIEKVILLVTTMQDANGNLNSTTKTHHSAKHTSGRLTTPCPAFYKQYGINVTPKKKTS